MEIEQLSEWKEVNDCDVAFYSGEVDEYPSEQVNAFGVKGSLDFHFYIVNQLDLSASQDLTDMEM